MEPFFSIVILAREPLHLLPLTLDTIQSQSEKSFEILVVSSSKQAIAPLSSELRWIQSEDIKISEMMNEGIRAAKGRYLQFLDPGDRFLSYQGLSYLRQLIQDSREPHLVYSGFLMRGPDDPPEAVSFSFNLETLQKGDVSQSFPLLLVPARFAAGARRVRSAVRVPAGLRFPLPTLSKKRSKRCL